MAAFIKAINARIRSNPILDYICSTRTYALIWNFPRLSLISPMTEDLVLSGVIKSCVACVKLYGRMGEIESVSMSINGGFSLASSCVQRDETFIETWREKNYGV
jgi:hypothetical protein